MEMRNGSVQRGYIGAILLYFPHKAECDHIICVLVCHRYTGTYILYIASNHPCSPLSIPAHCGTERVV